MTDDENHGPSVNFSYNAVRLSTLALLILASVLSTSAVFAQRSHRVRSGQSFARIARRYNIHVWDLALANRMRPSQPLREGQTLTIPPRGITYVRPGQTLARIARNHECTVQELRRLNRRARRGSLQIGQRIVLPGYTPPERQSPVERWGNPERPGHIHLRRRAEEHHIQVLNSERHVRHEAISSLGEIMRQHESDEAQAPAPRLAYLLAVISNHFGGRLINLVSGIRRARGHTRETSRHVTGSALDIRIEGVPNRVVWNFCRSLRNTGCGYYPRSTFVHVDVRDQAAQWVDWSRPGQRPRYGDLRGPERRRRGNRRRRRRVTRQVTRPDLLPNEVSISQPEPDRQP